MTLGDRAHSTTLEANARFAALMEAAPELRPLVSSSFRFPAARAWKRAIGYPAALIVTGLCTAVSWWFFPRLNSASIGMLYVLGTAIVALRCGRAPATLTSAANMLLLDYLFIPPRFRLDVADPSNYLTLAVMLCVALVVTQLVSAVQRQRLAAERRERRTAALYEMGRQLCSAADTGSILSAATRHVSCVFGAAAVILTRDAEGRLSGAAGFTSHDGAESGHDVPLAARCDPSVAADVMSTGARVTDDMIYLPLRAQRGVEAVLVVSPLDPQGEFFDEQLNLLETFASQIALALQGTRWAEQAARSAEAAERARITGERALVCNTLLSSISHDLRTPLAAIAGAGNLIAQPSCPANADRLTMLGELIEQKAHDMSSLLAKILQFARLELGETRLTTDWHSVDELIAHSLGVNAARLSHHPVLLELPADLPQLQVEATLIVQILNNLLENVAKHTPPGTHITISAKVSDDGDDLVISVSDSGPGLPSGDASGAFECRARLRGRDSGGGLGLAICRVAARLHGGDIDAANVPGGGARFEVRLPVTRREDVGARLDFAADRA